VDPDSQSRLSASRVEQLRAARVRPGRARDLSQDFAYLGARLTRNHRKLAAIRKAWLACCPPDLIASTAIVSMSRGVLTVGADDSAVRFELDRWLRTGGQNNLIAAGPALRKVKVIVSNGRTQHDR